VHDSPAYNQCIKTYLLVCLIKNVYHLGDTDAYSSCNRNFRSQELSFPGTKLIANDMELLERKFQGTFAAMLSIQ